MWQNNVGLISEIFDMQLTIGVGFICTCAKDILYDKKSHISHNSSTVWVHPLLTSGGQNSRKYFSTCLSDKLDSAQHLDLKLKTRSRLTVNYNCLSLRPQFRIRMLFVRDIVSILIGYDRKINNLGRSYKTLRAQLVVVQGLKLDHYWFVAFILSQ